MARIEVENGAIEKATSTIYRNNNNGGEYFLIKIADGYAVLQLIGGDLRITVRVSRIPELFTEI